MDKPLSFSAYKDYTTCAHYFKLKRIDKVPAGGDTTALAVGTIVDTIVMGILEGKDIDHTPLIHEAAQKKLLFYPDDLDLDLVDLPSLGGIAHGLGVDIGLNGELLKKWIKAPDSCSKDEYRILHAATWESLSTKIVAMLDSFEKWILPQIKEVHDIQTHLDDGVTHGYLDFTATVKDGRKVLFDLKTSKMPYSKDAVIKSPQLSLYAAMHDYEYAGFIILSKTLRKNKIKTCLSCDYEVTGGNRTNCPTCKTRMQATQSPTSYSQILIDKVPDWNKVLTKQAMVDTLNAIKQGHFPRNLNACQWMYGKPCPFVKKCWRSDAL